VWQEPAGLVVGEAAVRGVPVIASDVGGLPEYVPPPCRPLLCPPGDAPALAQRIRTFAAQPQNYAVDPSMVGTWDDHVDAVLAAYDRARILSGALATVA
jgi:glycosyltransferase involved in cell wall biosynthesis